MHLLAVIGLAATFVPATTDVARPSLEGTWSGSWTKGGSAIAVTVRFARNGDDWVGELDSDALRVIGVPFRDVSFVAPVARWRLVGDATSTAFEGRLEEDALTGTFDENGAAGRFQLQRVATSAVGEITTHDLTFKNGDVTLSGTLLLANATATPLPAIVFLHGSGAEGRWATRYLATRFAQAGFAALIWDKRGVGHSTGDWRTAGFEELADDAAAAIAALRAHPSVDPHRIGVHGHSQGGALAPLVVNRSRDVAFVIASAAPGVPMDACERFSVGNAIGIDRLPDDEAALARRFVETLVAAAYQDAPREDLTAAWEAVRGKPWAFAPPGPDSHYWSFSRKIAAFRPVDHWRQVEAPALLVYGERDERVPPRASAAAITDALLQGAGRSVTTWVFPDADHTFRRPAREREAWPANADGYPDRVIRWAVEAVAPNRPGTQAAGPHSLR